MATQPEKAFCVLEFHSTKSVIKLFSGNSKESSKRILQAIAKTDQPLLQNVRHLVEYRLDVCRATNGAHTELA
jgi:hypothetical protein